MKMKLDTVMAAHSELSGLAALALPIKMSFAIRKNIEEFELIVRDIEKQRLLLCEQYAKKDEEGKPILLTVTENGAEKQIYDIDPDDTRKIMEEFRDFLQEETEVNIRKIKFELLEECEKDKRFNIPTVRQQAALAFMLEE